MSDVIMFVILAVISAAFFYMKLKNYQQAKEHGDSGMVKYHLVSMIVLISLPIVFVVLKMTT